MRQIWLSSTDSQLHPEIITPNRLSINLSFFFLFCRFPVDTFFFLSQCRLTRFTSFPIGLPSRIHQLLLCRGGEVRPLNKCPNYDTKQSDGEVPVMFELWGMRSILSLLSLPVPLLPGVVAPDDLVLSHREESVSLCETKLLEKELFWHLSCELMLN